MAGSGPATSGVMKTEAGVGGMSGLRATASAGKGEAAEGSVGKIDALARHKESMAIGKDTEKYLEEQKMVTGLGAFECGARRGLKRKCSEKRNPRPALKTRGRGTRPRTGRKLCSPALGGIQRS